ncbi:hypothetical protein AMTR_s00109p00111650 [Amborella trichopoda]|uniref:Uncharacterized protein n=1 Tax=Amborella trichopoda TaxID=13333 RepID=W1NVI2_AMBTC|nr:hypothetical protein AMTR_s00109p00111650 [Amborella trichopoda]
MTDDEDQEMSDDEEDPQPRDQVEMSDDEGEKHEAGAHTGAIVPALTSGLAKLTIGGFHGGGAKLTIGGFHGGGAKLTIGRFHGGGGREGVESLPPYLPLYLPALTSGLTKLTIAHIAERLSCYHKT